MELWAAILGSVLSWLDKLWLQSQTPESGILVQLHLEYPANKPSTLASKCKYVHTFIFLQTHGYALTLTYVYKDIQFPNLCYIENPTLRTQMTITELDLWGFFEVFTSHLCQIINDIVYMQQKHMHLFIHIGHAISIHINGLFTNYFSKFRDSSSYWRCSSWVKMTLLSPWGLF